MVRYTEYHGGKAVIKDKTLLPQAMEKLAKIEDMKDRHREQKGRPVIKIIEEVCEDICDNYCKYRDTADEDCVCDAMRNGGKCPLDRLF